MTKPTQIYFGPDGGEFEGRAPWKIYFRALLYATAKRGRIIESMYVRLHRAETSQNFPIWVYGEKALSRGSGLFVPDTGVAANHHFLLPWDGTAFKFVAGHYSIEIFANLVGDEEFKLLHTVEVDVSPSEAAALESPDKGIYWDWGPDTGKYISHVRHKPKGELPPFLRELIG